MPKLTDLISDIDERLEAKRQRIATVEENARKAREKKERQRAQDDEERRAAQRERQHEHQRKHREKKAEAKGKDTSLSVEERILLAEHPDLADLSPIQRELVLRLRAYHAKVEIHHPPDRRNKAIALDITTTRGRHSYNRITRDGHGDRFNTLEEALSSTVAEARQERKRTARRERVMEALMRLHIPAEHIRHHAWRGEYEPGFAPTESICSDWRIAASRDPAEGTWTPALARAQVTTLLRTLPERERTVIAMRYGIGDQRPMTLDAIGEQFGLTRERVRQLESIALKAMRKITEGEEPNPSPSAREPGKSRRRSDAFVLTDEQLALVLAAREKGHMQKEVAAALGVPVWKLAAALKVAGHSWRNG